ncbi:DUF2225 domain-containing protein [Salisediminibacterium halotolerans]|uniref:DUF2225 domain-containing protein n=1 Tax=Salisediminibacterium halotolerans TaxID=517425 RepID=A0A1H9TLY1_9BACI|nr:DUF2225 domain-containing protein [Salisediminibacterium haloalkalitolerans]SER98037.1 hypothetical protein SAMN05444126_11074 [Salisediminibacterium haloalkalitolerans]
MGVSIPYFYRIDCTCTICHSAFSSQKLRSRYIRLKESHADFYKEYKDPLLNPLLYEVYVCPACGFSFTDQFDEVKDAECITSFKDKISANWGRRDFSAERSYEDASDAYKLALVASELTEQPYVVRGAVCMRLVWISRFLNNQREEARFRRQMLEHYKRSYLNGDFRDKGMSELVLLLLLGEYNRQEANFTDAQRYFSNVIEHKDRHLEPKIVEAVRNQWYELRSEQKTGR